MSLTAVYQHELKKTRSAVVNQVRMHWHALPDYDKDRVEPFVSKVVPIVEAGQRRAIAMTDAYLSRVLKQQPIGLDVASLIGASVRNGVEPAVVYARPFTTLWMSIANIGFDLALQKATNRLLSTTEMDVSLSARDATRAYGLAQPDRVIGFQRAADPECCDFCLSIDGAYCKSEDASPLHNNCSCTLEPLSKDSGVTSEDFVSFAPGSVFGDTIIQEHGELGPMIMNKDYNFTGPQDINQKAYQKSLDLVP